VERRRKKFGSQRRRPIDSRLWFDSFRPPQKKKKKEKKRKKEQD